MSQPSEWLAGSAKELVLETNPVIETDSIHASIHTTSGDLLASGTATYSGDGLYFCNLDINASWGLDVGSHYYAKWTMLYGTLADGNPATTLKTQKIYLVELES